MVVGGIDAPDSTSGSQKMGTEHAQLKPMGILSGIYKLIITHLGMILVASVSVFLSNVEC